MHRHQSNRSPARILAQTAAPAAELVLEARLSIEAAADDGKPIKAEIIAYTGGKMSPPGFGEGVVVELAGLELPESIPLQIDHERSVLSTIGSGRPRIDIAKGELRVSAQLAGDVDAVRHLVKLHRAGSPLPTSIGAAVKESEYVPAGKSVVINGAKHDGPFLHVKRAELYEVSFVFTGADRKARASIAASALPTQNGDILRAERERVAAIIQATATDSIADQHHQEVRELQARAIAGEVTLEGTQRRMLELLRASRPVSVPGGLVPRGRSGGPPTGQAIAAALALHGGADPKMTENAYGAEVLEAASELRVRHFLDVAELILQASGREVPRDKSELIAMAIRDAPAIEGSFSTVSIPTIVSDVLNKLVAEQLRSEDQGWRKYAKIVNVPNFHAAKVGRLTNLKRWEAVTPQGELTHAHLGESFYEVTADTAGQMAAVSRKDLVNDDAGFLSAIPMMVGLGGARALADAVAEAILGNAGSFFHADNANLISGAGTSLGLDGLALAYAKMRNQTDETGRPISMVPRVLLVPTGLEMTARAIINSAEILGSDGPSGNPWKGLLEVETEPRLENSAFSGYSATAWFLLSAAVYGAVVIAFLNGRDHPTVETSATDFNTLGLRFRGYFDFGAALGEPKAAVKSAGG